MQRPNPASRLLLIAIIALSACNEFNSDKGKSTLTTTGSDSAALRDTYSAKTACLLSEIAYLGNMEEAVTKYMPGWKLVWEAKEFNGNHAFVATNDTIYGMGIRGSIINFSYAAFQNWILQDFNIATLENWKYTNDSSKAKISEGAWIGFDNLKNMVDKTTGKTLYTFFDSVAKPNLPILISGHSLGGNLATVFGSWLHSEYKSTGKNPGIINVITFAAPAAGNAAFASDFNAKFPNSLRFENSNDMVPKFPCRARISELGKLFNSGPNASKITVGYNNLTTSLNKVFDLTSAAMFLMELKSSNSEYRQTNNAGSIINIPLSGKNNTHDIGSWFAEANYQHSLGNYAIQIGAPLVSFSK